MVSKRGGGTDMWEGIRVFLVWGRLVQFRLAIGCWAGLAFFPTQKMPIYLIRVRDDDERQRTTTLSIFFNIKILFF